MAEMGNEAKASVPLSKLAYDEVFKRILNVVERNVVPDRFVRMGICYLLSKRAKESSPSSGEDHEQRLNEFVEELKSLPIAIETDAANEQHYEVPTEYFNLVLGPHRKYSCCLYSLPTMKLKEAEEAMLELCCKRAQLEDGQNMLELGCGWGSLCLYMAQTYPNSKVTAVSNSKTQKEYIMSQAKARGLDNIIVITANVVNFTPPADSGGGYDRVVSIEMFEHMKNYEELMRRISTWLKPNGKLFVHIFVHRLGLPYHYEVHGEDDWMTKYFFAGGTMPSMDLLVRFQKHLICTHTWYVNGVNYSKTLEDWLSKHDAAKSKILPLFENTYGKDQALKWYVYWRLFYLACSEMFAYEGGERWGVGHYLFTKRP